MITVDESAGASNAGASISRFGAMNDYFLASRRVGAKRSVLILLGTILFLIPAAWNGHPFLFPDSEHYFIIGRSILGGLARLSGASVAVSGGPVMADPSPSTDTVGGLAAIAGGRSPIYALLLYVVTTKASAWWMIVLQSALVCWLILNFLDLVCDVRRAVTVLTGLAFLSIATSAGAFSGFLMPDIFAATFVLAALLLTFGDNVTPMGALAYTGVIALSLVMHTTIAVLAASTLILLALCLLTPLTRRLVRKEALFWIGGALILGLAFNAVYLRLAERVSGHPVGAPPYLMARVIADGPGRMLLAETCTASDSPFAACAFAGQPFVDHNDFLWGSGSHGPNFSTSSAAVRAALSAEEGRFVRAAFLRHPMDQVVASTRNAMRQLFSVSLTEFIIGTHLLVDDAEFRNASILKEIPRLDRCVAQPGVCSKEAALFPTLQIGFSVNFLSCLAAMAISGLYWAGRFKFKEEIRTRMDRLMLVGAGISILLLINSMACGALSGPHDRYQARLAWLSTLFMVALAIRLSALIKPQHSRKLA